VPRAVELARAAWVAVPTAPDAVDSLLEWLASPPSATTALEARARISAHAHGAEHAPDPARRIMHLEAMAVLQEETLGDAWAAAAAYEAILRVDGTRRIALVGLARAASRAGDGARLARARLDEAALSADAKTADALRVRAADALSSIDAERALAIVHDVLVRTPDHAGARQIERRLHEAAGMWAHADASLAARIEHAHGEEEKVDLLLARVELQRTRLRSPKDALASLRAILAIDPRHPAGREGLAAELEAIGDPRALRDGLAELAAIAPSAQERARAWARAAEIDELVLSDDRHAAELYARARRESPDDPWLEDRELRLLHRLARDGGQEALRAALAARLERVPDDTERAFELACALLDDGSDAERAASLVERVLEADPKASHALRSFEHMARSSGSAERLARALANEVDAFAADAPKLGALWAEAAVVEWRVPGGDATSLVAAILDRTPADRSALAASARLAVPRVRRRASDAPEDAAARARLVASLRADLSQEVAETGKLCAHIAMGIMLELDEGASDGERKRAALSHYREALALDACSVVGAEGVGRLGAELHDAEAIVAAALARADLPENAKQRPVFLVQAARQTLSSRGLGTRLECLARAGEMLERALDADPEALPAVALLVAVRNEESPNRDPLLNALRRAFERATSSHVVETLGIEVARLASVDPPDRVLAVDALRRVLAASPGHVAALRALADQYAGLGAWREAVDALQQLVATAREPRARIAALFELAQVYGAKLGRPAEAERSLRAALDIDPVSVDALRKLLKVRRTASAAPGEIAGLLARLGDAEKQPESKAAALTELAELYRLGGDVAGAEKALVEATAQSPNGARLTRLALLHEAPADHARALGAVVARAEELGRPSADCIAELGCIEVDALARWTTGVAHLRVALALAPAKHAARAALAKGLTHLHEGAEAIGVLVTMMIPDPAPLLSLVDPAAALATLEEAFAADARHEEAVVARELRAIAGGLDDGAHVELRARRLAVDPAAPVPVLYDAATLRASVVPAEVPALLLDVAAAIAGAAGRFARVDLEELGVSPRDRLVGPPLLVQRLPRAFGLVPPEILVSVATGRARAVAHETPMIVVPESLLALPEPTQAALLAGPLVRLALGVPWIEDLRGAYAHAVFCAAARQVVDGYASEVGDAETQELVEEFTERVARAIGRKQKRALLDLAPALRATRPLVAADVAAFEQALARAELRAAFLLTGDLLSTLDSARLVDGELFLATSSVGKSSLSATLTHPLAIDLVAFALAPATTALRRRGGSVWGRSR
jgi:tetratricopeptide (TPR) repeat protein